MRHSESTLRSPKQARSALSTGAILDAAAALIAERGVAATSVAAVARSASSSVGAIYFRFGDKERLVAAVLQRAMDAIGSEIESLLADARLQRHGAVTLLTRYVALAVSVFRRERGLMRAVFAQSLTETGAFDPWRQLGIDSRKRLAAALEGMTEMRRVEQREFRLLAGMQAVYGTLLSATMNRAWPMDLDDPRMADELARMLLGYLGLAPVTSAGRRATTPLAGRSARRRV